MPLATRLSPLGSDPPPSFWRVVLDKAMRDEVTLRASGLAYSTLASLIPVVAIILVVLSGPSFKDTRDQVFDRIISVLVPTDGGWMLTDEDDQRLEQQHQYKEEFQAKVSELAARQGAVSVFGFLVLTATVGLLFRAVENAFNAIWRVNQRRPFFTRVAIATSLIFWGPVVLAVSVSVSSFLDSFPIGGTFIVPTLFTTAAFTAFYMLMPHAKVKLRCAIVAALSAAVVWELAKSGFLTYVLRVVSYSRVYGSLGLIPMLFLWVYINWVIVLCGAILAYSLQHKQIMTEQWVSDHKVEREEKLAQHAPPPATLVLAVAIESARHFRSQPAGSIRISELATALKVEPGLAREAAERLVRSGILATVAAGKGEESSDDDPAFLPARDPQTCGVGVLLQAVHNDPLASKTGPAWDQARSIIEAVAELDGARLKTMTLADLAK